MAGNQLSSIQHIVQLMLENRSFDHMLGFLYPNKSGPNGVPFEGLPGTESNLDGSGNPVTVYPIDTTQAGAYFMPGADPGEGYANTNSQLFGAGKPPSPAVATNTGFVTNFAAAITYDSRTTARRWRAPSPPTSWASSPPPRCRSCPGWQPGSRSAITGSAPCRPRRSRTGRSPARAPARAT